MTTTDGTWLPLPAQDISRVLTNALNDGVIDASIPYAMMFDIGLFRERLRSLKNEFGPNTLHAMAIKANPLLEVLRLAAQEEIGVEAASIAELHLARKAGFPPQAIVYDSPVKTKDEIERALRLGVHLNADSFAELERVAEIVERLELRPRVGLRINPQVGSGAIGYTSTAGIYSKFGVPLGECREEIVAAYLEYPWLSSIHSHIGSQTISVEMLLAGIDCIVQLVDEIHRAAPGKISTIDIGGGLPAAYRRGVPGTSAAQYARLLKDRFGRLFDPQNRLVLEFGRHIHANLGWAVSRVEYVKPYGDRLTAYIHFGADLFVRECYNPNDWHHDILVLDRNGRIKEAPLRKTNIAGPLCFSGDFIGRDILVPAVEADDYIVVCDAGAYSFSMWSRYNSRPMPPFFGYEDGASFRVLKAAESIDDVIRCW